MSMHALDQAFARPMLLAALGVLPVLSLLGLWARRRRRFALARLGGFLALHPARRWPRALRGLFLLWGLTSLGVAVAGPRWGRDWSQAAAPGRDVVVVLDFSRSMLAETPSRLEQARDALLDLDQALRKKGGHRLALVVFAAKPRLACPLTHDHDHFREVVSELAIGGPDPDLEPTSDDPSGTRIGRALTFAADAFDARSVGARDILLLSDGDDPARDGEWRTGARLGPAKAGIPVHCVGLGDPDEEQPVPDVPEARTRLQQGPLREVASITGGTVLFPGKARLPLGEYYLSLTAGQAQRQEGDALPVYKPRYVWFLLPAFCFLTLALLIPDLVRRPRSTHEGLLP
jgi:Ca-activated chloride channel family protein